MILPKTGEGSQRALLSASVEFSKNVIAPESVLVEAAKLSHFGFGTARLHRLPSRSDRVLQIEKAVDAGFRHFDTAPLYGFGEAERCLASIAKEAGVTVATKVGLYPPGGTEQSWFSIACRKAGGRVLPALSKPRVDGSIERADRSLTASLKRLGRQHVDLLLIHEPDIRVLNTDEWIRWREYRSAEVGQFGLAGEPERISQVLGANGPWTDILQTSGRWFTATADVPDRRRPDFVYGGPIHDLVANYPGSRVLVSSRDPAGLAERLLRNVSQGRRS